MQTSHIESLRGGAQSNHQTWDISFYSTLCLLHWIGIRYLESHGANIVLVLIERNPSVVFVFQTV